MTDARGERPTAAIENLTSHQEQCDMDGVMVQVSRQALDEVLAYLTRPAPVPQCEAEPVAWRWHMKGAVSWVYDPVPQWREAMMDDEHLEFQPLYAAPPSRLDAESAELTQFLLRQLDGPMPASTEVLAKELSYALLTRFPLVPPPSPPDHVAVPKAALDWLFGIGPDEKGWHFGECRVAQLAMNTKNPRRYWWRAKFRKLAALSTDPGTVAVTSTHHSTEAK